MARTVADSVVLKNNCVTMKIANVFRSNFLRAKILSFNLEKVLAQKRVVAQDSIKTINRRDPPVSPQRGLLKIQD